MMVMVVLCAIDLDQTHSAQSPSNSAMAESVAEAAALVELRLLGSETLGDCRVCVCV